MNDRTVTEDAIVDANFDQDHLLGDLSLDAIAGDDDDDRISLPLDHEELLGATTALPTRERSGAMLAIATENTRNS